MTHKGALSPGQRDREDADNKKRLDALEKGRWFREVAVPGIRLDRRRGRDRSRHLEGNALNVLFGTRSEKLLANLNPRLVGVLRLALSYDEMDFTIIETLRTPAEEAVKVAAGLNQTMKSKHLAGPDGKARAVDIAPWPIDWADINAFKRLAGIIQRAADELKVKIIWGGSWRTLKDWGHFELA